jgi:hypothetical protein
MATGVLHSAKAANSMYHSFCLSGVALTSEGASPCKIGSLAEILTSIHCLKPATSVTDCKGCCTLQDLPFVCGCAYQAKGASTCKMVLWSRSRLVGVCTFSFPRPNSTGRDNLWSFQIIGSMFCVFVLISGSESSDG